MKKVVLGIMAIAISFATTAQSEQGKQKGHRKGENKELHEGRKAFKEEMNLSDAQKAQMKTINENFRTQRKTLSADKSLSPDARKQRFETLRSEHRSQISALLTPDQRTKFEQKIKDHRKGGGRKFDKKDRKDRKGE